MNSLIFFFALVGFMFLSDHLSMHLKNVLSSYERQPPKYRFIELLVNALFYLFTTISFPVWLLTLAIIKPMINDKVSEVRSNLAALSKSNEEHAYQSGYEEGYSFGFQQGSDDALSNHFLSSVNEIVLQKQENMPIFYARRAAALKETAAANHFSVCETNVTYHHFLEQFKLAPATSDLSKLFGLSIWEETFRFITHEYYDDFPNEEISLIDPLEILYVWSALYYTLLDLMVEKGIAGSVQSYFQAGLKQLLPDVPVWFIRKLAQEQTIYLHTLNASGIAPHVIQGANSLFRLTAHFAFNKESQGDHFPSELMHAAMRLNATCAEHSINRQ